MRLGIMDLQMETRLMHQSESITKLHNKGKRVDLK
jgi:hypothetical protein